MNRSLVMLAGIFFTAAGCLDVRDFEGTWTGERVGEHADLRQGFADDASATLVIDHATLRAMDARLTIAGVLDSAIITPVAGAEADVLASMTFDGAPARVFLSFAPGVDGGGDALVMIALYDDPRVDVRVLRGGSSPLYGIFSLRNRAREP
jgi:hypothetical protein